MPRALRGALAALALFTAACTGDESRPPANGTATTARPPRPVRIGVTMPPELTGNTYGAAAVRSLVYPQLFRATPDGRWEASLVQPGSDKTRPGALSARFRLRRNAQWSDGRPITVSDLRRTLDARVVAGIEDPTPSGTIVVRFAQAFPGWRRLWSGYDAITPPRQDVFGGPYRVTRITPGLETVLAPNRRWWGTRPAIREVRLVLAPQPETQARLMEQGELDVIAPFAFTDRTRRLQRIDDARVVRGSLRGGWTASLVANAERVAQPQRQTLFALANAPRFVDVLLHGEATPIGKRVAAPGTPAAGATSITAPLESPPANLLLHGMQRAAHKAGRSFDLRQGDFDRILGTDAAGDYDVILRLAPTTPGAPDTDELVRDFRMLPLWRERPVAAVRDGLDGVSVNGFSVAGPAWNVETWRWR